MKVAIVAFNNIKYSPYIKTYSDFLDAEKIDYDVILPNRNGFDEKLGDKTYLIEWNGNKSKLYNFIKFASKAKKILKKNKYDFICVLTAFPAVLLSTFLVTRYNNRYLIDIRDFTYENFLPYFLLEKLVIKHASMRVISSSDFKAFLPNSQYCLCHNTSYDFSNAKSCFEKKVNGRIVIGYVGSIAYANQCKHLIDLVDKDERFEFHFYGNETHGNTISDYVASLKNERIKCFGSYEPSQKNEIIESVDILFNVYGNGSPLVKYAVSNKLYDSFYFKKPILTSPDTTMSKLVQDFSYDIDFETRSLDSLFDWYMSLDDKKMLDLINSSINVIVDDINTFDNKLRSIFKC